MTFAFLAQPVLVVAAALLVDFSAAAALSSLAAVSAVAFLVGLTAVAAFASVAFFFASFASVRAFFFASFASVRRCAAAFLRFFCCSSCSRRSVSCRDGLRCLGQYMTSSTAGYHIPGIRCPGGAIVATVVNGRFLGRSGFIYKVAWEKWVFSGLGEVGLR